MKLGLDEFDIEEVVFSLLKGEKPPKSIDQECVKKLSKIFEKVLMAFDDDKTDAEIAKSVKIADAKDIEAIRIASDKFLAEKSGEDTNKSNETENAAALESERDKNIKLLIQVRDDPNTPIRDRMDAISKLNKMQSWDGNNEDTYQTKLIEECLSFMTNFTIEELEETAELFKVEILEPGIPIQEQYDKIRNS